MTGSVRAPREQCERHDPPDVVVWEADGWIDGRLGYGNPIARRLSRAGLVATVVPLVERPPTEAELAASAHVVSGGNTSVHAGAPWLEAARDRLNGVVDRAFEGSASVTGICFGAQLIATLLVGARAVGPHRLGMQAGLVDAVDGRTGATHVVSSFHFHHIDRMAVEAVGADVSLSSDATPVQAFEIGEVRGVQFHPEFTPELLATTMRTNRTVVERHGLALDDVEASIRSRRSAWNDGLWQRFAVDPARRLTASSMAPLEPLGWSPASQLSLAAASTRV